MKTWRIKKRESNVFTPVTYATQSCYPNSRHLERKCRKLVRSTVAGDWTTLNSSHDKAAYKHFMHEPVSFQQLYWATF